jgi:hypothetical protein
LGGFINFGNSDGFNMTSDDAGRLFGISLVGLAIADICEEGLGIRTCLSLYNNKAPPINSAAMIMMNAGLVEFFFIIHFQ